MSAKEATTRVVYNSNNMSSKTCETCGSMGKDHGLLPYPILPKEVTESSEITALKIVTLCANCRKEIGTWYHIKVRKVRYDIESRQFIPLPAEELAKEYESVYSSFYVYKRFIRIKDKFPTI